MKIINWETAPRDLLLLDNEVHLWRANLNIHLEQIEQLTNILSTDERERANRFRFAEHRDRFIAARGYLRQIMSRYLQISSKEIEFSYSDRGKPKLESDRLQFNVSHSQNIALYGFTKHNLIGIDIEYLRTEVEFSKIAQRFFTNQESQLIATLNKAQQLTTFFHYWTIKEAYLKATGEGLVGGLETVEIDCDRVFETKVSAISGNKKEVNNWVFDSFLPKDNFVATMAIKNQKQVLTIRQFALN